MRAAASISARCENACGKFRRWLPFLNRILQQRSRSGQRVYSAGRDGPPFTKKQIRNGISKGIWIRFQVLLSACAAYGMHWPIAGRSTDCRDAPAMSCHTEIPLKNCFFVNRAGGAWDLDAPLAVSRLHAWKETMLLRGCCTDDSCNFHSMSTHQPKASQPFDADARLYTRLRVLSLQQR